LPYIPSYKSKNVGQILALKTRGQLICLSSFCQQLFQGCPCKSTADSCRDMLAKRRQSGSMAMADDTESASDAPMPISKERRSSTVASARPHRPQTTHLLPVSTELSRVAAAALPACRRRTLCHHQASCTNVTPCSPETEVPPQRRLIHGCQILHVFFDIQGGSRLICESTCARVYTVRKFSGKTGLAPCEENCIVH